MPRHDLTGPFTRFVALACLDKVLDSWLPATRPQAIGTHWAWPGHIDHPCKIVEWALSATYAVNATVVDPIPPSAHSQRSEFLGSVINDS